MAKAIRFRRWVARNFTVCRTHTRTSIIVSHALAHRTSIFDNRTRTRTFSYYIPYARHYNPRFVYFLPNIWSPKTFFQWGFFRKSCPYVWIVFKSGIWWRAYGIYIWYLWKLKPSVVKICITKSVRNKLQILLSNLRMYL